MIKTVSEKEITEIKNQNDFFDFEALELNYGYCNKICFKDEKEIVTYSDLKFGAKRNLYYDSVEIIISVIKDVMRLFNEQREIVVKYNCFALFIFDGCIIAPSDHMEVFIWLRDIGLKTKLNNILQQYEENLLEIQDIE